MHTYNVRVIPCSIKTGKRKQQSTVLKNGQLKIEPGDDKAYILRNIDVTGALEMDHMY